MYCATQRQNSDSPLGPTMITKTLGSAVLSAVISSLISPGIIVGQAHQRPLYPGPLDSATLARLVDNHLALARKSYDAMLASQGPRTVGNTLRLWDEARNHANDASGLSEIAINVYPDSAVRQEGIRAEQRVSRFRNELATDPRGARAFQALDSSRAAPSRSDAEGFPPRRRAAPGLSARPGSRLPRDARPAEHRLRSQHRRGHYHSARQ